MPNTRRGRRRQEAEDVRDRDLLQLEDDGPADVQEIDPPRPARLTRSPQVREPEVVEDATPPAAPTPAEAPDPWRGVETMFRDAPEISPEHPRIDNLGLEWERPETLVRQGESDSVVLRLNELAQSLLGVDRRLREMSPALRAIQDDSRQAPAHLVLERMQTLEERVEALAKDQAQATQEAVDSLTQLHRNISELASTVQSAPDTTEPHPDLARNERLEILERSFDDVRVQQERTAMQVGRIAESIDAAVSDLRPMIESAGSVPASSPEVLDRIEALRLAVGDGTESALLAKLDERLDVLGRIEERMDGLERAVTLNGAALDEQLMERLESIEAAIEDAGLDEPLQQIAERLAATEGRLQELAEESERLAEASEARAEEAEAGFKLADQISDALSRDPFDIISSKDLEGVTNDIVGKVKRLAIRVDRLEAAIDRGLAGIEEARRAAVASAQDIGKAMKQVADDRKRNEGPKPAGRKAAPRKAATGTTKRAPASRTTRGSSKR